MQEGSIMKVPEKYEPKNTDEFGTFDRAMTNLLAVPAAELQRKIKKHKKRKKKSKSSESGPSRDSA
jgi:hypothetical protein